jgi:guanine deaminase
MISCKEVFEKSPNRPIVVEKILNEEGLKVFDGYKF